MLAGSFLGKRTSALSLILFIVLVAIGLPVLSGGSGGFSVLIGPSAGFILSWPIAAFLIGFATEKIWTNLKIWKLIIINVVFGVLLVSLIGAPIMALITQTSIWTGLISATIYLPGDLIKAIIAAVITMRVKPVSPINQIRY